jgi:hypothetical protein
MTMTLTDFFDNQLKNNSPNLEYYILLYISDTLK